ncbi:sensor histidine kinase [Nubsella zeaxanthinifaciens]|uniref:sensor histidine kinase n=1 Tax=Nubsella zeaxanthinifaciens TaxID=392412 RepID=UPI000DE23598|nr:two-component regulator propeller domain-containing protein [Nubsella zeaxanthinifaciens]
MKTIKILSYCFYLLLLIASKSLAQTVFLPHYTTKDGLPSNNCFYTLQDKKGFIWVATDAGVSRFDGSVFENFSVDDGLPDNQVLQIREDSKGRLWFMALNGQLSYFLDGKIHNESNDAALKELNFNGVVVSFLEDSKGNLWFGTNNNIIGSWDGKQTKKFLSNNSQYKFQNAFIYEDEKGKIRAINKSANFVLANGNFVKTSNSFFPLSYKAINKQQDAIYFLNEEGLQLLKNGTQTTVLKLNKQLINSDLGYIFLGEKRLWLGNENGVFGIDIDDQNNKRFLANVGINQTIRDNQGNLWFTTKNGIYKLPQLKDQLYTFGKVNGLEKPMVKSIIKDKSNRLWLGSSDGTINILFIATKKINTIQLPDANKFAVIKQLVRDDLNNRIFFASDLGLGSVNSNYPQSNSFKFLRELNDNVFVIKNFTIDSTTKLTLSLSSGVVIINDRNKLEFSAFKYKEQRDFFKDRSYRVFYDKDQNLWFSNISGLSEFNHNKLNKHYEKYNILSKRINDIRQLADGSIAMATDGYGIVILKDGKITHLLNHTKGLSSNIINKLFVRDGYLWAISNTGINRISFKQKKAQVSAFDDLNGIFSDDLNDLYIDKDTAYFATNNGLVYFKYNHTLQQTEAPNIYITSVVNNKVALNLTQNSFSIPTKDLSITINYAAVDFKNRNITYRYRLKGNQSWIETKNRRVELSSLEPGQYIFEVSAKSQNSTWSKPAKIKLNLEKRFYQSWWFIATALLLGAYLIYISSVNITKRQKNKEQEKLLLKNRILMLEQQALQAMMNPHFVFNVMNSIQHFINTKNTASANKILTGFAKLIRKNLEICTQSYISLEEELNYLQLYLTLEKNRFGEKLQFKITVADDIDKEETLIPSMLLQPYIENAIWHGIMPKEEGGNISLEIKATAKDTLLISITDDGVGIDNSLAEKKQGHNSKGMDLTKERINLLNKIEAKPIHLDIKQNGKTGTTVTLELPLNA